MKTAFDAFSKNYGQTVQSSIDFAGLPHDYFMQAKADLLREVVCERFPGERNLSALDAGCGVGKLHPLLNGMFSSLTGVDVSLASIEEAQIANRNVSYLAYDGGSLPFATASFDFTFTICVVHHVPVGEWHDYLADLRRVTRPGGCVAIIEHNPFNPGTRIAVARCEFDHDAVLLSARKSRALMREAGFTQVNSRYFLLLPTAAGWARRIERAMRTLPLGAQYITLGTA